MESYYHDFTPNALNREYSPSSCVDDMGVFLKRYKDLSQDVRENQDYAMGRFLDLPYSAKPTNMLDLFMPASSVKNPPLQVYVHGGYWQELDKSDSAFLVQNFNCFGAAAAVINYTLAPAATMDQIVSEVAQSIAWLHESASSYGYDPERIYLSGSSAGAHLALMMLYQNWSQYKLPNDVIKGVCAVSGIYDLTPIAMTYVNDPLQLTQKQIATHSPLMNSPSLICPVILAYGDIETSEFKRQSIECNHFLLKCGFDVELLKVKQRNHFDVILDLADDQSALCQSVFKQMNLQPC